MRLPVLALGAIMALTASASARDRFDADWGGDCGPALQCWLEIRPAGKAGTYRIRYVAADRMDASDVRCETRGNVRRANGSRLVGTISGGKLIGIRSVGAGRISVSGSGGSPCGLPLRVNGIYTPIGD